jgi:hypothetical protein
MSVFQNSQHSIHKTLRIWSCMYKHVCVCVCVCLCVRSVSWAVEVVGIIIHVKSFSGVSFSNVLWSDFVKRFGHRDVLTVVTGSMQAQANKQAWCCCAKLVCCCCKGASGREPPSPPLPNSFSWWEDPHLLECWHSRVRLPVGGKESGDGCDFFGDSWVSDWEEEEEEESGEEKSLGAIGAGGRWLSGKKVGRVGGGGWEKKQELWRE